MKWAVLRNCEVKTVVYDVLRNPGLWHMSVHVADFFESQIEEGEMSWYEVAYHMEHLGFSTPTGIPLAVAEFLGRLRVANAY